MARSISLLAADDRVELALAGQLGQVAAEAVQGGRLDLAALAAARRGCRRAAAAGSPPSAPSMPCAQQVQHLLADLLQLQAQVHQHLGGHAFLLAQQAQQDVLGADVVVVQVAGLLHRVLDDLLGPRRLRQLAHRDHVGAALDELLDLQADLAQIDVQVLQHVGGHAAAFLDQAQQDVLGADVFVVEPLGLLVGQLHHLAGAVGKSFVHSLLLQNSCRVAPGTFPSNPPMEPTQNVMPTMPVPLRPKPAARTGRRSQITALHAGNPPVERGASQALARRSPQPIVSASLYPPPVPAVARHHQVPL